MIFPLQVMMVRLLRSHPDPCSAWFSAWMTIFTGLLLTSPAAPEIYWLRVIFPETANRHAVELNDVLIQETSYLSSCTPYEILLKSSFMGFFNILRLLIHPPEKRLPVQQALRCQQPVALLLPGPGPGRSSGSTIPLIIMALWTCPIFNRKILEN